MQHNTTHRYIDILVFQIPIKILYRMHKTLVVEKILQRIYGHLYHVFYFSRKKKKIIICVLYSNVFHSLVFVIYFWYLTAPRRFVMLLIRVFVICTIAVVLFPKSDILVRYIIDEADPSLHAELDVDVLAPASLLKLVVWCCCCCCWLPSLECEDKVVLVLWLLQYFHGKDDALLVWIVLFE